jgi:hypothetical protein
MLWIFPSSFKFRSEEMRYGDSTVFNVIRNDYMASLL